MDSSVTVVEQVCDTSPDADLPCGPIRDRFFAFPGLLAGRSLRGERGEVMERLSAWRRRHRPPSVAAEKGGGSSVRVRAEIEI
jgi:hypothetical protein